LGFHYDLVAVFDELIGRGREKGHAMLLRFDLLGNSDDHEIYFAPERKFAKAVSLLIASRLTDLLRITLCTRSFSS
jgi:hypothetical protein